MEDSKRLPSIGKMSVDDLRSPAYVREAYRFETVKVGPPYHTEEIDAKTGKKEEGCPAWTAYAMLDATLDKNDWSRSYIKVTHKLRGRSTGPQESIRMVGRTGSQSMVQLPSLRPGAKPRVPYVRKPKPGMPSSGPPAVPTGPPVKTVPHSGTAIADPVPAESSAGRQEEPAGEGGTA